MGIGEIFALASAINWAFAVILFKRSGETMSPTALNLFKNLLTLVIMTLTVCAVYGLDWPMLETGDLWLVMLSGALGIAIADNLYFHALNTIGAGRTGIISSIYSPSVITLSILFLGERLTSSQVIGFILVMTGIALISMDRQIRESLPRPVLVRGMLIGTLSVFLMAVGVLIIKSILEREAFLVVVEFRFISGVLTLMLMVLLTGRTRALLHEYRQPHHWWSILLSSFIGTYLGVMFWLAGYKYTLASIAAVLNETASIFILLLARWFLKEKLTRQKIIAIVLTFLGVLVMLL